MPGRAPAQQVRVLQGAHAKQAARGVAGVCSRPTGSLYAPPAVQNERPAFHVFAHAIIPPACLPAFCPSRGTPLRPSFHRTYRRPPRRDPIKLRDVPSSPQQKKTRKRGRTAASPHLGHAHNFRPSAARGRLEARTLRTLHEGGRSKPPSSGGCYRAGGRGYRSAGSPRTSSWIRASRYSCVAGPLVPPSPSGDHRRPSTAHRHFCAQQEVCQRARSRASND